MFYRSNLYVLKPSLRNCGYVYQIDLVHNLHLQSFERQLFLVHAHVNDLAFQQVLVNVLSLAFVACYKNTRSEERRVGKECRYWWSREHRKKNRKVVIEDREISRDSR